MLDKIYKDENKLSNMDDNFNFKVAIFYNKCKRVRLLVDVYIYDTLIMLSGQTQMHYYANHNDTSTFN